MIVVPQILFENPQVKTILRDGNTCILKKTLTSSLVNREGYISNHVIVVLIKGRQEIRNFDGNKISVKEGEVLFIPRGMYYISDFIAKEGTFKSLLFYFDDSIIEEYLSKTRLTNFAKDNATDHLKIKLVPSIQTFSEALINIYESRSIENKEFLNVKILELCFLIGESVQNQDFDNFLFNLTLPKKRNIKSFMEANFDKPLMIEDYAYLTGRSLSTFRRDFKSSFNITPQKWIRGKRMKKALFLIEGGNYRVADLAFEVGFENVSYFIKAFKKETGYSPKQYMLIRQKNNVRN